MYVVGSAGDEINEYSLSTPWDISTASYVRLFSISGQENTAAGLFFKPDGTRMYVIGSAGDDVNEYSLSTAWNISTASFVRVSASLGAQDTLPSAVVFRPDGARMYTIGTGTDNINEYSLTIPWDVSSITFVQSLYIGYTGEVTPTGLDFKSDGTKLYFVGNGFDFVHELNLG
jgi:DNA-binding beta-propeller fold protein YncE